jgi:hypothetical protein
MSGAPERLSTFGAIIFTTVITTYDFHLKKIAGVDCSKR